VDVPVFEFRCSECSETLEVIVLGREKCPTTCPACGGQLRRRWSRVGAQLVGWGFARNDALIGDDRPRKPFRTIRDKAAELFD
jgi:putative FmdB family regulatory protein